MPNPNKHSASGQMLGYLFQIERAMYWLSQCSNEGGVGIETTDDVVAQIKKGKGIDKIFEQDKNSVSKKLPYSDQGEDLWKTLCIWLNKIKTTEIDINTSKFYMVSNKNIPSNRIIYKLCNAKDDLELNQQLENFKIIGRKIQKRNKYAALVLQFSDDELKILINRIVVSSVDIQGDGMKKAIKDNLHIPNNLPFSSIYESLSGWLLNSIVDCWRKGEEAWISGEALNKRLTNIITQFNEKPFLEKAIHVLPVNPSQRNAVSNRNFVRQLQLLETKEEEIIDAINDFLRASWEKTRYAKECNLTSSDFNSFYNNLIERWKTIFNLKIRLKMKESKLEDVGYDIYNTTISHREKLAGYETQEYYTTKGAYHQLADNLELGWHPEWKDKL